MTSYPPISIFALQTPEERARTERLSKALEECGPEERRLAFERAGLPAPDQLEIEDDVNAPSGKKPHENARASERVNRNRAVAACAALVVAIAVAVPVGYSMGWSNGAMTAAQEAQTAEAATAAEAAQVAEKPVSDLERREANVALRFEKLGIDMKSADRVSAQSLNPVTVDKVDVKPATELKRIGDVDVSKGTKAKLDVPLVNQLDDSHGGRALVNGCEVASLAMLLQFAGVKVTKEELQDAMPTVPLVGEDGMRGNPNKAFVGAMEGDIGAREGYSVYHGPIAALAQEYLLNRSFKVVDLTGRSFTMVLKELASGNPVWVITTTTMQPDLIEETWDTSDGPIRINWLLHCVALTGFDDKNVYVNDPYGYEQNVPYDRDGFEQAWKLMGSQAVVIVPTE